MFGVLPPLMSVYVFAIDGLLVDTGLPVFQQQVLAFCRRHQVSQCFLTHYHEDHSGNAANLSDAGIPVSAGKETGRIIARPFPILPYQKIAWGVARPTTTRITPDLVETGHHRFTVIPTPGHSHDMMILHEPEEGWLFSGDLFIAEKVKIFRRDEDFHASLASLRQVSRLAFDHLFCAHNPVSPGGRQALRNKLQHFEDLLGATLRLHEEGCSVDEISEKLLGRDRLTKLLFTQYDASRPNLIRSILHGPTPRML